MIRTSCARILLVMVPVLASAEPEAPPSTADAQLRTLSRILVGRWSCQGHFADGRSISSTESFEPLPEGRWMLQEHSDDAPFDYRAHSLWGWNDDLRRFTVTIFDNFGGQRLFTSPGWQRDALTLEAQTLLTPPARQERFLYRTLAGGGYSVEYQVLQSSGTWKVGDLLECRARH
jgi:hypothetical protein